jgi:hypothetical protein
MAASAFSLLTPKKQTQKDHMGRVLAENTIHLVHAAVTVACSQH